MRYRDKGSAIALAALIALSPSLVLATGCSSSSNGGETQAQEEEKSQLPGLYKLSSASKISAGGFSGSANELEEKGFFVIFTFNNNETGKVSIYQNGEETNPNEFTWKVADDDPNSFTLTINGVDSYVTLEGDKLNLKSGNDGEYTGTLTRITEEDLQASIDEALAKAADSQVALGQTVTTDNYEFTLDSFSIEEEIYPPDTSGYYSYYDDEPGSQYIVVRGTFKNLGAEFADVKFGTDAKFKINDKYEIGAQVEGATDGDSGFYTRQVDPLQTIQVTIFASVSDEMVGQMSTAQLEWSFTDNLNTYYNSSNASATYDVALQ